jgi:hypothetical protein
VPTALNGKLIAPSPLKKPSSGFPGEGNLSILIAADRRAVDSLIGV